MPKFDSEIHHYSFFLDHLNGVFMLIDPTDGDMIENCAYLGSIHAHHQDAVSTLDLLQTIAKLVEANSEEKYSMLSINAHGSEKLN